MCDLSMVMSLPATFYDSVIVSISKKNSTQTEKMENWGGEGLSSCQSERVATVEQFERNMSRLPFVSGT